jgi:ATP-dependent Clp protease protease subunit
MTFLKSLICAAVVIVSGGMSGAQDVVDERCQVRFFAFMESATMDALLSQIEDPQVCAEGQRVRLTVQSGGGEVDAGMFAYKMLRKHPAGVDTHVEYSAASMGLILLLAGDGRTMSADAYLLIHQVSQYVEGEYELDKLKEFTEGHEISHRDYVAVVAERTGLPTEEVEKLMAEHTYLSAEQALEMGFVTGISN